MYGCDLDDDPTINTVWCLAAAGRGGRWVFGDQMIDDDDEMMAIGDGDDARWVRDATGGRG